MDRTVRGGQADSAAKNDCSWKRGGLGSATPPSRPSQARPGRFGSLEPVRLGRAPAGLSSPPRTCAAARCRARRPRRALPARTCRRPDRFELLVDDVADLDEAAEAQALGVLGRRLRGHLLDGHVRARVRVVEALRLGQLVGGGGDRQVAGELVPVRLHLGRGQVAEELGDALVLLGVMALQHPQRRAADDGVLRGVGPTSGQ